MNISSIFIIINPSAGSNEPIEEIIGEIFNDSGLQVKLHILNKDDDPAEIARKAAQIANIVAIFGGDGSVTQAAAGLINTTTPLAIIPGGTANVLAKELGIPQDAQTALRLLKERSYQLKKIDTGIVNGRPFLLRINLGIMARMITETDPDLKDKIGQLAYGVATIKSLLNTDAVNYRLHIDGEIINTRGVALTVTNAGSMGIGSMQLLSDISISDGLLDVVLLEDAGLLSILKATGSAMLGKETDSVKHWQGRQITVELPPNDVCLCDDLEIPAEQLAIKIMPASLTVVVPLSDQYD